MDKTLESLTMERRQKAKALIGEKHAEQPPKSKAKRQYKKREIILVPAKVLTVTVVGVTH